MHQNQKTTDDLKMIKKHYGEKMMYFCREQFATLLEEPGLLFKIFQNNFASNKFLYEDLDVYGKMGDFKNYIYDFANDQEEIISEEVATPDELLAEVGYKLYECHTEEDVQKFRKYYEKNEELCTFNGGRLNRCHVYFALKNDIESIKREYFMEPERQDEYGTSIISIQFTKDGSYTLSIKNRYNHRVENPDATFGNDLDNIVQGLTTSFAKHYGMEQKYVNKFELPNYVKAKNGKYYKYNYEINNTYYCINNTIIDNFRVKKIPSDKQLLIDYFILDLQKKQLKLYDDTINDSFVNDLNYIKKIVITNNDAKNKDIYIHYLDESEDSKITINKEQKIIGYVNNNIKQVGDNFLFINDALENITLPQVQKIDDYFLLNNNKVKSVFFPNLEQLGSHFFRFNKDLEISFLPKLKSIGKDFLFSNDALKNLSLLNLEQIDNDFLCKNGCLEQLELPLVKKIGDNFLTNNYDLTTLSLPNLEKVGSNFLVLNKNVENVAFPKLSQVSHSFLHNNRKLKSIILPNLKEVGDSFLYNNEILEDITLCNLKTAGRNFLLSNKKLTSLSLPNLTQADYNFLYSNRVLNKILLPNLKQIDNNFLYSNIDLEHLFLLNLQKAGHNFLVYNENLTKLTAPNLEQVGDNFLAENQVLEELILLNLDEFGANFLNSNQKLRSEFCGTKNKRNQ